MTRDETKKKVLLAEITGAHGIRGDILLRSYAADPLDLPRYAPLTTLSGERSYEIKNIRFSNKRLLARVVGVDDRNAAESLKGTKLYVDRERLDTPRDGEYLHIDLIGLDVVSPDDEPLGKVVAVENFGAGDLLEVQLLGERKTTQYVPFTNEYVPEVELAEGRLVVILPTYTADTSGQD